jgi:hypothetical protein
VGTLRRYSGVVAGVHHAFPSDEFVKSRDGGLAIDGDFEPARSRPRNTKFIERRAEQSANVVGSVREVVPDTPNPAIVRDHAAAIVIDQAANELLGGLFHEHFVPRLEPDRPQVLPAWSVLRQKAWPVLRIV